MDDDLKNITSSDLIDFDGAMTNSSMLAEFLMEMTQNRAEETDRSRMNKTSENKTMETSLNAFLRELLSSTVMTSSPRPAEGASTMKNLRPEVTIPLYSLIFLLSVIGNILVILTLLQNRSMRTVTNIFLLNLAVSDLLLASFCMPFTLIPTLMQDFVFGHVVCVMVRYIQGMVVGVSVFTHVTISLERYFAICQPLKSRRWQTKKHCYRTIVLIWVLSSVLMVPTAACQRLVKLKRAQKCVEYWTNLQLEMIYVIILDLFLLVFPLVLMLSAYGVIAMTLFKSMRRHNGSTTAGSVTFGAKRQILVENRATSSGQRKHTSILRKVNEELSVSNEEGPIRPGISFRQKGRGGPRGSWCIRFDGRERLSTTTTVEPDAPVTQPASPPPSSSIRDRWYWKSRSLVVGSKTTNELTTTTSRNNNNKNKNRSRRRSVLMLFVVVTEFFVCWTPLFVVWTWSLFDRRGALEKVSPLGMNLIHLLAFVSCCCNPITYCFMSKKFRQGFFTVFGRCCCIANSSNQNGSMGGTTHERIRSSFRSNAFHGHGPSHRKLTKFLNPGDGITQVERQEEREGAFLGESSGVVPSSTQELVELKWRRRRDDVTMKNAAGRKSK